MSIRTTVQSINLCVSLSVRPSAVCLHRSTSRDTTATITLITSYFIAYCRQFYLKCFNLFAWYDDIDRQSYFSCCRPCESLYLRGGVSYETEASLYSRRRDFFDGPAIISTYQISWPATWLGRGRLSSGDESVARHRPLTPYGEQFLAMRLSSRPTTGRPLFRLTELSPLSPPLRLSAVWPLCHLVDAVKTILSSRRP